VSLDEPMFEPVPDEDPMAAARGCAFAALYVLGLAVAVFVGWMIWL
jgi:hypothetical protein